MPEIKRAKEILGWMSDDELTWLGEHAIRSKRIAEIGSFQGRSTRALADNTHGRVTAIDTWRDADIHPFLFAPPKSLSADWAWQGFLSNVGDLIPEKLTPHRMSSLTAAEKFADERFDLIFIDAAHDYASVKADINAWRPLLAEGGMLCGHDFTAKHMGVVKAVRGLVRTFRVCDTIWYAA